MKSRKQPFLSIVIPAYNEENRIEKTLVALDHFLQQRPAFLAANLDQSETDYSAAEHVEVLVVDDGSTDNTASIVEGFSDKSIIQLSLLRIEHAGKGAAVSAGMLASRGNWRMLCDADLAMSFEQIDEFFVAQKQQDVDVVIGSRQVDGAKRVDESVFRHMIGRLFNWWIQFLLLPGVEDTQCGYKLFSARAAQAVFQQLSVSGFAFDVEALFFARKQDFKIFELPVLWHAIEESKVSPLRDGLNMAWQCLRIRVLYTFKRKQSLKVEDTGAF